MFERISLSPAAVLALALAGASLSCAASKSQPPAVVVTPGASASEPEFRATARKPVGSNVDVKYRVDASGSVGQPVSVQLQFHGVAAEGASVRFTADAGLTLAGPGAAVALPRGTSRIALEVVPQAEGLFYLNVFTTQGGATSATSIPIQVGAVAAPARDDASVKPGAGGEKIIPMPVR